MKGRWLLAILLSLVLPVAWNGPAASRTPERLVVGASPSLAPALNALAAAFEASHPHVRVQIYYHSGLELRQAMAAMHNSGRFARQAPIHIVAPGGDELIDRLESKGYLVPGTRTPYARVPLVLVVPEGQVEAPASFEAVLAASSLRVAVADPRITELGQKTAELLDSLGASQHLRDRLDVAADSQAVIDHLLSGHADVGILLGPDGARDQRLRIVAWGDESRYHPTPHSMAMDRFCPNRTLCHGFLQFVTTGTAQTVLRQQGYLLP